MTGLVNSPGGCGPSCDALESLAAGPRPSHCRLLVRVAAGGPCPSHKWPLIRVADDSPSESLVAPPPPDPESLSAPVRSSESLTGRSQPCPTGASRATLRKWIKAGCSFPPHCPFAPQC